MIRVVVKSKHIVITGHADYADKGQDIVCASVSSIVTTSINAALRIDADYLIYEYKKDKLDILIKKDNNDAYLVMENMIVMLEELSQTYKKNIKVSKEGIL